MENLQSSDSIQACSVCKRNLEYVKSPITLDERVFCGLGCLSIADGTTARRMRRSRKTDRAFLLLRYYLLLMLGLGACVASVIIYGDYFSGSFTFRRPISFLAVPIFGVSISFYSLKEILKPNRRRR
jgi:hypothetical protein